ncbi:TatD family hydrolase [Paenibacillus sp. strain BS8-2]
MAEHREQSCRNGESPSPERTSRPLALGSIPVIDAHIHIDLYPVDQQEALLEEARRQQVDAVVAVSMDLNSSMRTRELARRHTGFVHPAYGYHPEQEPPTLEERELLLDWIRERHRGGESFAIGEVGLPYYKRSEAVAEGAAFDEEPYIELLECFVALAAELNRPIVLHAVYEDADKVCNLLERYGVRDAHFHWFKGSAETMERMVKAGYLISVTPDVGYEEEIQDVVRRYPLELMMAETDGPWPFEGPYADRETVPAMTRESVIGIAAIKGMDPLETAEKLYLQTRKFYRL